MTRKCPPEMLFEVFKPEIHPNHLGLCQLMRFSGKAGGGEPQLLYMVIPLWCF